MNKLDLEGFALWIRDNVYETHKGWAYKGVFLTDSQIADKYIDLNKKP